MEKRERLYEGKAKIAFATDDPGLVIFEFKDAATAFDGKKKGTILGKGAVNARISAVLFKYLEERGIPTHFKELLSPVDMLALKVEIIPVEVVMRNIVAGSLSKRLGIEEGRSLDEPVLEFYYKSDELGDPMINQYHVRAMKLASDDELLRIVELSFAIDRHLKGFFAARKLELVDFKLEFGRRGGDVYLADEISPDTCRLWDMSTREKLDKDRFRRDLGGVEDAYQEVLRRVEGPGEQS
ncbi:MAG: phosphoribosylaminoimidazolesuccinocarboxamide synthase [Firmicutes bacterium]|nr:phosphoribosylaminoimidazolesuccinocarboxamide synthase [Bacillota bacterium]